MSLLLIPVFLCVLPRLRFSGRAFQPAPLCREQTDALKGFFALLVLLSHSAYSYDIYYLMQTRPRTFYFFDQQIVAPFLFFAGYALCECIREKPSYHGKLPLRRIGSFAAAVLALNGLSLLFAVLIGETPDGKTALLSLIGLAKPYESRLGSVGWFAVIVFLLYLLTGLSLRLFPQKRRAAILWLSLVCVGLYVLLRLLSLRDFWYNTLLFYPAGFWLSEGKKPLFAFLQKSNGRFAALCALSLGLYLLFYFWYRRTAGQTAFTLMCVFLLAMLVLLAQKIALRSRLLLFAGRYALGLYLFQSIPMKCLELAEQHGVFAALPAALSDGLGKLDAYGYAVAAAILTFLPFVLYSWMIRGRKAHDTAQ